ncbi:hypothetical protein [Rhodococcus rhodochrous]|uniref:hypothetical protein n=1 Tax=Rhodococcus rhodochrous TaxID=1829 RepID=UPI0012FE6A20|nr:hypothetical protein [Rhodococcus rhodochrous]
MKKIASVLTISATLLVVAACGANVSAPDPVDEVQSLTDLLGSEPKDGNSCADSELNENLTMEEYIPAFLELARDPVASEELSQDMDDYWNAQSMTESYIAEWLEATPPGGQGKYAREVCAVLMTQLDPSLKGHSGPYEVPLTGLLAPGYAGCMSNRATVESENIFESLNVFENITPRERARLSLLQFQILNDVFLIMGYKAVEYLCPHIPNEYSSLTEAIDSYSSERAKVEAEAEKLGVCGLIQLSDGTTGFVDVLHGNVSCKDAETVATELAGSSKVDYSSGTNKDWMCRYEVGNVSIPAVTCNHPNGASIIVTEHGFDG